MENFLFLRIILSYHGYVNKSQQVSTCNFNIKLILSRMDTSVSPSVAMCGSRKYPYPHHGGNWKFRGGERPRKFQRGGGLDDQFCFQMLFDSIRIQVLL